MRIYEARSSTSGVAREAATPAPDATADAISEVIARLGAAATQAKTLRAAVALCEARDQPLPTPRMVRAAFARELAGKDLAMRFGTTAGLAVDRTMLDLVVETDGDVKGAQLVCVVDLQAGRVIRHRLTAGPPALEDVVHVLTHVDQGDALVVSASDDVLRHLVEHTLSTLGNRPPQLSRWRSGAVVRAALGLRLGRVGLLERAPEPSSGTEGVDLGTARQVVREILRRSRRAQLAPED